MKTQQIQEQINLLFKKIQKPKFYFSKPPTFLNKLEDENGNILGFYIEFEKGLGCSDLIFNDEYENLQMVEYVDSTQFITAKFMCFIPHFHFFKDSPKMDEIRHWAWPLLKTHFSNSYKNTIFSSQPLQGCFIESYELADFLHVENEEEMHNFFNKEED